MAPTLARTRRGIRKVRCQWFTEGRPASGGSLIGNRDKKAKGRAEQDKVTLKKKKGAVKDLLK